MNQNSNWVGGTNSYTNNPTMQLQQQQTYGQGNQIQYGQQQQQQQQNNSKHPDGGQQQHQQHMQQQQQNFNNIISDSNSSNSGSNSSAPSSQNPMNSISIPGLANFGDSAAIASMLGQTQQALPAVLQQQLPSLFQQNLEQLLPLHQLQGQQQQQQGQPQHHQQQQQPAAMTPTPTSLHTGASNGNNNSNNNTNQLQQQQQQQQQTIQAPDAQALWQQALQTLTGVQQQNAATTSPFVGAGTNAGNAQSQQQQQVTQQFQQFMAAFPMAANLGQMSNMFPLQASNQQQQQHQQAQINQQAQAPQIQQPSPAPAPIPSQLQQQQQQPPPAQLQNAVPSQIHTSTMPSLNAERAASAPASALIGFPSAINAAAPLNNDQLNSSKRKAGNDDMNNNSSSSNQKMLKGGPSVVSFNSNQNDLCFPDKPPQRKSDRELEKMTESERRRYERNLREQQRSYKISQQIKQLRDVLAESNIPFRPNKYSILVSVAEYIRQLQSRAIMLDAEHQRLIDTIRKTNELVSSGAILNFSDEDGNNNNNSGAFPFPNQGGSGVAGVANDLLLVQGIDYETVFDHCPYPMGVATLDGRVLAANAGFEELMCCERGQMAEQSLFVYIRNHQEIFEAMAALLKRSSAAVETGEGTVKEQHLLFWRGNVVSPKNVKVPFTITLTSTADNNPKYFSLSAATPTNE